MFDRQTAGSIRITSRPAGGAPEAIRDKWIGVEIPTRGETNVPLADVMTRERVDRRGGYAVSFEDAMSALGRTAPDARDWWMQNVPGMSTLIFDKGCCEFIPV